jgi:hypothetical protein
MLDRGLAQNPYAINRMSAASRIADVFANRVLPSNQPTTTPALLAKKST